MRKTKKEKKQNNGITLISLVITIIVMLILVGVSINLAVNGGLFEYAGNAVGDTKNAIKQEQDLINNIIDKHIKPNTGEVIIGNDGETFSAPYTKTEKNNYYDGEEYATIPAGFSVGTYPEEISKISTGLVIRDKEGNEFVWIPVEVTEGDDETSIASFYRSSWSSNARTTGLSTSYTEPYASGYSDGQGTEERNDYYDMLKSVYTYEGFYIGRYEAGTETPRTSSTTETTEDWVVQRDKYPYIYVGWGWDMDDYEGDVSTYGKGALYLCKNFYTNEDKVGVTSTLCYGVMWDAMLDFIKDDSHSVTDIRTWGNCKDNTGDDWKITRTTAKWTTSPSSDTEWTPVGEAGKQKESSSSILLTTGANDNFSAKNIYDVAGNVREWTMEAYSAYSRVSRGGFYIINGGDDPASSRRNNNPNGCDLSIGFRPALYITNNA